MKKALCFIAALLLAVPVFANTEDIVKQLLPDSDLKARTVILSDSDIEKVNMYIGDLNAVNGAYTVYPSKTGAVILDEEQGKHGMIQAAVLIDKVTGKIKNIIIIKMKERRGRGIKTPLFLNQFRDKTKADPLVFGKDVKVISGATASSKAMLTLIKRSLIIYEIYLSKKLK